MYMPCCLTDTVQGHHDIDVICKVITCGQGALCAHFSQQQQSSALAQPHRLQAIDDARPRDDMSVSHV